MNDSVRLGLLFLVCARDVSQPRVWKEFVASADGQMRLYCHPKQPLDPASLLSGWEIRERHLTRWGGLGIVRAMFALLTAAMDNGELTHFLFVSESCAPIKPWRQIEAALAADPRSRIHWTAWADMQQTHQVRRNQTRIATPFWRLHPQWVLLDRETAGFLLDRIGALGQFERVQCPDEHAIGTILAIHGYDMNKVSRQATTWVRWTGGIHPQTIDAITPELRWQWQSFGGFCARKFSPQVDLHSLGWHLP